MTDTVERPLDLGGSFVAATVVAGAAGHRVGGRAVVVNCAPGDAWVAESPRRPIPPMTSTIVTDTTIEGAELLVVLRTDDEKAERIAGIADEPGWALLGELLGDRIGDGHGTTGGLPFDKGIPLSRGPQHTIGRVEFDPARVLREPAAAGTPDTFEVRVNLWFAPAGTDCFIHNRHDFIEVHTQVAGLGRMQKFREQDHSTLYQDLPMSPGYTTPDPFCSLGPDHTYVYPWHQYRADTDCVWLAIEYHRVPR
ncbi:hypothetical protein ACH4ZX_12260 [Streptomyces sp. NPDC020490]|uniref:hypothetical protein n=1 Tax=Streptomyces sp. NPDC020490 TaxID=3365078 RepID=UPI0037A6E439